jgi:VWFA-related protein
LAGLLAQAGTPAAGQEQAQGQSPTFRVQIAAVTLDVVARDSNGRFIPDLAKGEFEIYEDGVKQEIASMTMSHGGRVTNVLVAPQAPAPEGVILPTRRVATDTSGRIFMFFVDDLHLQFQASGRVRELFKQIAQQLVHDGDLFSIVSSGPSSIRVGLTYDRKQLLDTIDKITGDGLRPFDVINAAAGPGGPTELRYRAQVAFATMRENLRQLEKVQNRRKVLVWVSEGYDFNPFQESRLGLREPSSPFMQNWLQQFAGEEGVDRRSDPTVVQQQQDETFSDADLAFALGDITRAANRANTTIFTIDPRGLMVASSDIDQPVDPVEWGHYIQTSQQSMRLLAAETGGLAVVNMNDFEGALKRIDAETSDYYVLGYYSTNTDVNRRRRRIEVRVTRPDTQVWSRTEYFIPPAVPPPCKGADCQQR